MSCQALTRWFSLHGRMAKTSLAAFSLPAIILAMSTVSSWAVSGAEWDGLSKGQVLVSQNLAPANTMPSVEAKILIAKPPEKVWKVVADPEKLMREEHKVKKVKILSRTATKQNVEFSVLMTRFLPPFNYVLLQELSPPSLLTFKRISGSFKDIQGSWKLLPVDNGNKTILTYTLKIDPGPFLPIPRGMLLNAVKSDLPSMMKNAKSAIDKGV
ncbi:MAG: cyclase/dehydrase [Vampirovibrio sp.]|nr:cyclase/dehydrase [Vampirovibrio sp.]